jgi:hypothetical protein
MVQTFHERGRKRYGPGSPCRRHDDSGSPSSDTVWSREPENAVQALRDQPEDRGEAEEADFNVIGPHAMVPG